MCARVWVCVCVSEQWKMRRRWGICVQICWKGTKIKYWLWGLNISLLKKRTNLIQNINDALAVREKYAQIQAFSCTLFVSLKKEAFCVPKTLKKQWNKKSRTNLMYFGILFGLLGYSQNPKRDTFCSSHLKLLVRA